MPSKRHQEVLMETINELKNQGYNAIDMTGCIPDGIAVKDNKIYAIEVLILKGSSNENKQWANHPVIKRKQIKYKAFDDTLFKITGKKRQISLNKSTKNEQKEYCVPIDISKRKETASQIVQNFLDNGCKIT